MMVGARLRFKTSHPTQFVDITERLRQEVRKAGLRMGRVHLQSMHTTVGIAVNENEPLLLRDFEGLLERLAPAGAGYHHDDFARRFDIRLDEPINGHAHCRQLLLTGFATLLVEDGDLLLGRWQSVFAVELDGPQDRQLAVQLDGDFMASATSGVNVATDHIAELIGHIDVPLGPDRDGLGEAQDPLGPGADHRGGGVRAGSRAGAETGFGARLENSGPREQAAGAPAAQRPHQRDGELRCQDLVIGEPLARRGGRRQLGLAPWRVCRGERLTHVDPVNAVAPLREPIEPGAHPPLLGVEVGDTS